MVKKQFGQSCETAIITLNLCQLSNPILAAAIVEITHEQGGCLPQDLNAKYFTPDEVAKHWHIAKSLAAVELRLIGKMPTKPKSIFEKK